MLITLATANAMAGNGEKLRKNNQLVFRTNGSLKGAEVEVLASDGHVVTRDRLVRKRLVIDFSQVGAGHYTVRVTKGEQVQEIAFYRP